MFHILKNIFSLKESNKQLSIKSQRMKREHKNKRNHRNHSHNSILQLYHQQTLTEYILGIVAGSFLNNKTQLLPYAQQ